MNMRKSSLMLFDKGLLGLVVGGGKEVLGFQGYSLYGISKHFQLDLWHVAVNPVKLSSDCVIFIIKYETYMLRQY